MSGNANSNVGRVFNLTSGSGDMAASVYDPTGKRQDAFAYADAAAAAALASAGDMDASVYDPTGKQQDVFAYADAAVAAALLNVGDMLASVYDPTGVQQDVFAYARNLVKSAFDNFYESLLTNRDITKELCDSSGDVIQDSSGNSILGRLVFEIK